MARLIIPAFALAVALATVVLVVSLLDRAAGVITSPCLGAAPSATGPNPASPCEAGGGDR